ncbi:hypothetical protein K1719_010147 [Acacia pycnantha]|nr:hypothetical protein K1719_010147 [Acacia pycnantha]
MFLFLCRCEFLRSHLLNISEVLSEDLLGTKFEEDNVFKESRNSIICSSSPTYRLLRGIFVVDGCWDSCIVFLSKNLKEYIHVGFSASNVMDSGCLRHKNLVQLQGWCVEESKLLLVYAYLPNGSLNRILHKNYNSSVVLSWKQRANIILRVASAFTYLHEECERHIIHRGVKTCNVMPDADFNAKLGDFGLAKVYEYSCDTREATVPVGTKGLPCSVS